MPRVALTRATPVAARRAGSTVPIRLMPSGMAAVASPVTARPTISQGSVSLSAQISEPTVSAAAAKTSIRRLPWRSASRPITGTATAPTSSVEVSSHWVFGPSAAVSSGSTGISSDVVSATMNPRTATTASADACCAVHPSPVSAGGPPGAVAVVGVTPDTRAPGFCGTTPIGSGTVCHVADYATSPSGTGGGPIEEAGIDGLRERKRADSRARVVDVALPLFAEHGYEAVTVADICRAADIAPRTFFRYFPTKEDVLAQPVQAMSDLMRREVLAAPAGLSDAEVMTRATLALGEVLVADRDRMTGLFRSARQASAVRAHPFLRLADRELELATDLARRRSATGRPDWRTRLAVARRTAAFRVWLDDLVDGVDGDPLAHLREILAEDAP